MSSVSRVVECNLDLICCGVWGIDLGPEGGNKGGEIVVAQYLPEVLACLRVVLVG
ncbi:MAG: hypothetical protein NTW02_00905 [Cyanobium sp. LacPavin_0920_WC12_MAG_62_9]|nr:hypothetical protein [Cyanobium sp. LacPavin_0920_WC12_MAG_62_9]